MEPTYRFTAPGYERAEIARSLDEVLSSTRLLSMATVDRLGNPWISNAYFAFDRHVFLYILTPPSTRHGQYLEERPSVAVAIADSQQTGDAGKRGIQGFGTCVLAAGDRLMNGLAKYRERFPAMSQALLSQESMIEAGMESRLYVISLEQIRLFDEVAFGPETWVDAVME